MSGYNKRVLTQLLLTIALAIIVIWFSMYHYTNGNKVRYKMAAGTLFTTTEQRQEGQMSSEQHVIHISTTICGLRVKDALVMMWSALVFTPNPIHFHLIVSKEVKPRILREVTSWHHMNVLQMHMTMYDTVFPWNHTSRDLMFHRAKQRPCTSQRLFLPEIIQSTDKILYVDTDVIFMTSAVSLWDEFKTFNENQGAGFVYESETPRGIYQTSLGYPFYRPFGLNAGVFLMDLSVIRTHHWSEDIQQIYGEFKDKLLYSDQDVINIYFDRHRKQLYRLPCAFNYRPSHCNPTAQCFTSSDHHHRKIALLHGSSQAFIMRSFRWTAFYDIYRIFSKSLQLKDFDQNGLIHRVGELFSQKSYTTCTQFIGIMSTSYPFNNHTSHL